MIRYALIAALTLALTPAAAQTPYDALKADTAARDDRIADMESRIEALEGAAAEVPIPIPEPAGNFLPSQAVADRCTDPVNPVAVPPGELDAALAALSQSSPATTLVLEAGAVYPHAGPQDVNLIDAADLTICGNGAVLEPEADDTTLAKGLLTTEWRVAPGEPATGILRVYDVTFRGGRNYDLNASGIRVQGAQHVECHGCVFRDMDGGILAGSGSDLWITDSLFAGLGTNGYSHGIYKNAGGSLIVERSVFRDTKKGMHVKSLADLTVVRDSEFVDLTAEGDCGPDTCASRQIEITHGGDALIEGNTFAKAAEAENSDVIYYALSRGGNAGEVVVRDNVADNAQEGARFIRNRTCSTVRADGNTLTGFGDPPEYGGGLISVDGGDAAERLAGREGYILGTAGDDTLTDDLHNGYYVISETMIGFAGADTLTSNTGRATLLGCDGDDTLVLGAGSKYFSAGAGDDTIEVTNLRSAASGSCGRGHDVFRPAGPYEPEAAGFQNRQWGKGRWMVRVVGGYRSIIAECEVIEFSDGTFFQIPATE